MTRLLQCFSGRLVLALALLIPIAGARAQTIRVPPGQPAVPAALDLPEELAGLAVSPDGAWVVAATLSGSGKDMRTSLTLYSGSGAATRAVELGGRVRALLFDSDGNGLFTVSSVARRHIELADLVHVDLRTLNTRRLVRVPPTTRDVAYGPGRRTLLLACQDEIRSLELPGLRAGRLYHVLGENLALVTIGESQVLVGQAGAFLVVDLSDPPERNQMPVRERIATPAPVQTLGLSADGSLALAQLADGSVLELGVGPLVLRGSLGPGLLPAGFAPTRFVSQPIPPPPAPRVPPSVEPQADAPARAVETRPPAPSPAPPPPPLAPPPAAARSQGEASGAEAQGDRVQGTLAGDAALEVRLIGVNGPDNILEVAARVEPAADGSWLVDGLRPGRYRVQPLGRPGRVLVVDPPYMMVDIGGPGPDPVVQFRVLSSH